MSRQALHVEHLRKEYQLGERQERYRTLRQALVQSFSGATSNGGRRIIQALNDVSFDVAEGEAVGIIGRNGAGKSTLLKVLSRITEPTSGFADIRGRIGSLIEVGTGFHPELTGRENVFLNAAILGMTRSEVVRKFDQIVAFAEVEEFIDTPVKHYSSGMYLRLAFAVAAHLEPDILLVDEVLAVGDVAFQTKCLHKMDEVAHRGRTVLFVSHNMSAIAELCSRAIVMDKGQIAFSGSPHQAVAAYLRANQVETDVEEPDAGGCSVGRIQVNGSESFTVTSGEPFTMSVTLHTNQVRNPWMFFMIEDAMGRTVIHNRVEGQDVGPRVLDGTCTIQLAVPALWLSPGVYTMYFKFLTSVADGSTGRAFSPRLALEVRGEVERTGQAVLNPSIRWSATIAEDAESTRVPA